MYKGLHAFLARNYTTLAHFYFIICVGPLCGKSILNKLVYKFDVVDYSCTDIHMYDIYVYIGQSFSYIA